VRSEVPPAIETMANPFLEDHIKRRNIEIAQLLSPGSLATAIGRPFY
jgi:hypothetical protein